MIDKALISQYVSSMLALDDTNNKLDQLLKVIDIDNNFSSLIPFDYYNTTNQLLIAHIGEDKFESLMYWMYDCVNEEGNRCFPVEDETGSTVISDFDKFYALVFEDKKVSDII